jgi:NDP-sugar pyrophosphorylase family protein
MKAVILAGGLGTRWSEEEPLPHGVGDFAICSERKGHVVTKYYAGREEQREVDLGKSHCPLSYPKTLREGLFAHAEAKL